MALIEYTRKAFQPKSLYIIREANTILDEYEAKTLDLTLRQLYYQMVARDIIPNNKREYNKLGEIINDARLAGYVDWDCIVDRTRNVMSVGHHASPINIVRAAAQSFRMDKWATQDYRPEVWIEKDALAGVVDGICSSLDVPYFACKGYVSQSEMWGAAQRLVAHIQNGQLPIIFHLGDHDPSGMQMTEDITNRLALFVEHHLQALNLGDETPVRIIRLALNMDQIRMLKPPPNPAKTTDIRYEGYVKKYRTKSSWELDALQPEFMVERIEEAILGIRNERAWSKIVKEETRHRELLAKTAEHWPAVVKMLEKKA